MQIDLNSSLLEFSENLNEVLKDNYTDEADIPDTFKNVLLYMNSVRRAYIQTTAKNSAPPRYTKILNRDFPKLIEGVETCLLLSQVYNDHAWYQQRAKPILEKMLSLLTNHQGLILSRPEAESVKVSKRPRLSNFS